MLPGALVYGSLSQLSPFVILVVALRGTHCCACTLCTPCTIMSMRYSHYWDCVGPGDNG